MMRKIGRDEEPRELGRVPEEGLGTDTNRVAGEKVVEGEWVSWGAEDPAFFIKPADGK